MSDSDLFSHKSLKYWDKEYPDTVNVELKLSAAQLTFLLASFTINDEHNDEITNLISNNRDYNIRQLERAVIKLFTEKHEKADGQFLDDNTMDNISELFD